MMYYKNEEWLEEKLKEYGSGSAIAKATNYPVTCINRYIRKFGLQSKRRIKTNRKYSLNESYFEVINSEEKAYWLGFFMADGCMYHGKTSYDIQFTLAKTEIDHLNKFSKAIEAEQKPIIKNQGIKDVAFFRVSSKKMYEDLISHGGSPRKTGKETIPDLDKSLIPHFIRGFFDGDGSFITQEKNYVTCSFIITCSNKKFIDDIYEYFKDLFDISFYIVFQNGAYTIKTTGKEKCYKIYNHIYKNPTIFLKRKNDLIQNFMNNYSPQHK